MSYGLSYPHVGFTGVAHIRIPTFMALIEDIAVTLAEMGFRRIVFLNGHYDNTYAIAYACAAARAAPARGHPRLPDQLLGRHAAGRGGRVLRPANGLHANAGETSAVMAINPDLVDLEAANHEMPPFPEVTNAAPGPHGVLLLVAGLGLPRHAVRDLGRPAPELRRVRARYLDVVTDATVRVLDDIARTEAAMPDR